MRLVERQAVRRSSPLWPQLDSLCLASKNLYNASLYDIRQHYFTTGKSKSWQTTRVDFVRVNQPDYRALPAKLSGAVVQRVGRNFTSFFGALKSKRGGTNNRTVRIPQYLAKDGRAVVEYPKDTISKKPVMLDNGRYQHVCCPTDSRARLVITSEHEQIDGVRIVPQANHYVIEIIFTVPDVPIVHEPGRVAAIDLGVSNLITLVSTVAPPVIWNGRPVKSINQYFNKRLAHQKTMLPEGVYWSKACQQLTDRRNRRLDWELHNVTKQVVNYLVSHRVGTLVVGYNKEWKQGARLGRRNNQNFIGIPYYKVLKQLEYKCALAGIEFVVTEESYTSKCSFLDREQIGKHDRYVGRRVRRGLFRTASGRLMNADVNGAGNILRKVVPDEVIYSQGIEGFAVNPEVTTISRPRIH